MSLTRRLQFVSELLTACLVVAPLAPPALPGARRRRGLLHVEHGPLPDRRADVVQVGAQHDEYGEEGEPEAEAPDAAAAQREAEPVDQPAEQNRT